MKRYLVAEAKRSLTIAVCVAMGLGTAILNETPVRAQNQNSRPLQSSDLAKENLSRVAASAGEIKPVLLKDSGLLVELKRWVAKDATDHGQIITDTDLTDDAIFDRLENDVQFRAVATLLLQQYGYLVPQVNPDSDLAKQQQLLIQERIKWITQDEEEARTQQRTQLTQTRQNTRYCAAGLSGDCTEQRLRTSPGQGLGGEQQMQPQLPAQPSNPNAPGLPAFPGQGTNPLERAQLMQTGEDASRDFSKLGSGDSFDAQSALGGSDAAALSQNNEAVFSSLTGDSANLQNLAMSGGADLTSSVNQNDMNPFATNQPSASPPASSVAMTQATLNRRNQQIAALQNPQMVRAANPYRDIPSLYDMYLQATPRPATPKRFGMDVSKMPCKTQA